MTIIAWLEKLYAAIVKLTSNERADATAILQSEANLTAQLNKVGSAISFSFSQVLQQLQTIQDTQAAEGVQLQLIIDTLGHQFRSLTITYRDESGNIIPKEIGMPFQLTDGGAGSHLFATPTETDAAGNPVTIDPTKITYAASDPTAFTITPNATASPIPSPDVPGQTIPPGGAEIAAVATAGHLGSFQITVVDTGNNIQAQDTVTVVSGAATALTIGGTVV